MRNSFIQLLFVLIVSNACHKIQEKVIHVNGKVVNAGNNVPIDSAIVYLNDGVGNSGPINLGSTSSGREGSAVTNAKGEFSITIRSEYIPYISATKKDFRYRYHDQGAVTGAMPLTRDKYQNNVIVRLEGDTDFCGLFSCKENNCDSLKIQFLLYPDYLNGRPSCAGSGINECRCLMCFDGRQPFSYCSGNIVQGLIGDRYFRFNLDVKRNGIWTMKKDSAFLKTGEVFRDTIYY